MIQAALCHNPGLRNQPSNPLVYPKHPYSGGGERGRSHSLFNFCWNHKQMAHLAWPEMPQCLDTQQSSIYVVLRLTTLKSTRVWNYRANQEATEKQIHICNQKKKQTEKQTQNPKPRLQRDNLTFASKEWNGPFRSEAASCKNIQ